MLISILRTRPDVAYAVNRLATRASISTPRDYESLRQVPAYLHTTAHLELVYSQSDKIRTAAPFKIFAYSDAAFLVHTVVVKIKSLFHLGQLWKVESSLDVIHLKIYPPFCIILQHQLHVCKHEIARSAKSKHVIVVQLADRIQIVFGDEGTRF
jgi:hypothetical protein